jgi:hypothetical protein
MRLISHRGNINGPNTSYENTFLHISKAINCGYECEIDVWKIYNELYLGHDWPKELIDEKELLSLKDKLWIHCKNIAALQYFNLNSFYDYNYFWHQEDNYTLTSKKWIWAYPGKHIIRNYESKIVCVMPEINNEHNFSGFSAICSDYIEKYSNETDSF